MKGKEKKVKTFVEPSLEVSELRYRRLFETAQDGFLILDADTGMITDVNLFLTKLLGYSREEFLEKRLWEVGAFKDIEASKNAFQALQKNEYIRYKDLPLRTKDDRLIRVEFFGNVYWAGSEKVIQCNIRDITERKRAEDEIKSMAKFPDENPFPILRLDDKGILLYANKAGRAALENWKTTIGQPAPEFWCTKVIEALENQSQQIIEVSIGARVISFVIIPIIGEGYVNLYGRDITESKRAEDALKKSEEKFREIFNSVNDAIYLFRLGKGDIPDKLTEVNDVACKMLGYSKEEFLELSPADFSVGGIGEKLQESITQLLSQGQMIVESLHRTKDGKIIPVEISSRLVEIMGETKILSVARDITERQRMKDALSDSEEQFRATFEQAAVGIAQVGLDGRWLRVNQRLCDIVGYTGEELLPLTFQDITHPDDLNIDLDYVRQILAGKIQTYSMEKRYIRKDRSMVWVNLTVGLVRDEAAAPKYFISVVEDITKRKQAEEVLKESEKRFSTAFFTSPVSQSIIAQGSNEIMEVNDACCRLFEYSREELIGASTAKLNLWEIPADRLSALEELQKTGQLLRQEATIRVKSGGIHTIIVAIEPISFKGIPCLISSLFDITERKQAEHALQRARDDLEIQVQKRTAALAESNALLQMLLDNSPDHIFFKDLQSRFIRTSKSQAQALGLSDPTEIIGKSDFDFFAHAQSSYENEQEIIRSGEPSVGQEEHVVWPDGRDTWGLTTKVPLRDAANNIIGTFGIFKDITQRKQAEQAMQKAEAELEAANKELEAFAYSVSHDLRAPLRAIDGFSQALLEDYADQLPVEGKQYLQRVRAATQHMAELIDDLLNLSRVTRASIQPGPTDLSAIAQRIADELLEFHPERNVKFEIAPGLTAEGDPHLLEIALQNLFGNAWKFTGKKEQAQIEFGMQEKDGEQIFFVRDNGAGFDMAYVDKLFGAFQRLHTLSEFPGTGIGLAMVQRIIHRHGGRVWAEGVVNEGASFYFTL